MNADYLKPHPADSKADDLLKRMLPDYKAEIRAAWRIRRRKGEPRFDKLPIVAESEAYLRQRAETDGFAKTIEAGRH